MATVITTGQQVNDETGIEAKHCDYKKLMPLWKEIRAVLFGKQGVIDLKMQLPLPYYTDTVKGTCNFDTIAINKKIYTYLNRGRLLSATAWTHDSNTGMIWAHEPDYFIPESMSYVDEYLRENVQKIVADVTSIGRYGVLLDSNPDSPATTGEMESGIGVPYWVMFEAEQIIYWRENEVRLLESYEVQLDDGISYSTEQQVRRLVLIDGVYHNQVWRNGELYEDLEPSINSSLLDYIPFQFFGSDDNGEDATKPPLADLASYNIGHFMLDCDNRDNLHWHCQATTNIYVDDPDAFAEANPNGLNTGAKGYNQFGKGDRAEILQIDATGACPAEMVRDEQRMIMTGAQLVRDKSGNQTLGAKKMEFGATTSTLKRSAMNVSEGVTKLLRWQAEMTGVSNVDEIYYNLNTEFITDAMTPEMLNTHMTMVQMGLLPQSTLNESARKAGLTKMEDDEIEAQLGEQAFNTTTTSQEEAVAQAASEE